LKVSGVRIEGEEFHAPEIERFAPAALNADEDVRAPRVSGFAAAHCGKPPAYHRLFISQRGFASVLSD